MNAPAGVALVGAGFISYMHVLAVRDNPNVRLVALASRSRDVAEHRARIFGAQAYTFDSLEAMLGREDVDIVIVASPVYLHAEHTLAAIRAGKHVVVEKPMVMTLIEAVAVEAAASSAGVGIGYAENLVFTPLLMKARELIEQGAVGSVKAVRCVFKHGGPQRHTWFWDARLAGGGAHLDLGSHALEVCRYLAGKPEITAVVSSRMTRNSDRGVDVTADCAMASAEGIDISISSSWTEPDDTCSCEVTGDAGVIRAVQQPVPQSLTLHATGGSPQDIDFPGRFDLYVDKYLASFGYTGQFAHFEACFRTKQTPRESAKDGRSVLRVLAAGYLAAASGRRVDLSRDVPVDKAPIELLNG